MSSCGGSCSTTTIASRAVFPDTQVHHRLWGLHKLKKGFLFNILILNNFILTSLFFFSAAVSWCREFKRLFDCIPCVEVQTLREHTDQVLHLAFSHRGHRFSSCSKDCTVKVWIEVPYFPDYKSLFFFHPLGWV